jgi:hypothetical protein
MTGVRRREAEEPGPALTVSFPRKLGAEANRRNFGFGISIAQGRPSAPGQELAFAFGSFAPIAAAAGQCDGSRKRTPGDRLALRL